MQERSEIATLLQQANDVVDRLGVLWSTFRTFRRVPVQMAVSVRSSIGRTGTLTVLLSDDGVADAVISFSDKFGDNVPEPGPVTWGVSDAALASVTPDAADDTKATVRALAGSGTFRITANSGALSGESDDVQIRPGAASSASIAVTLEPPAA